MSIRLATVQDLPRILDIYGPYVENTVCSFEYTVPTLPEFTQRFLDITAQFPWLVWEENGTIWMEKELNTWETPPHEPIPIHELQSNTSASSSSDNKVQ